MSDDDWDAQHAWEEASDAWYEHLEIEHAKMLLGWRERPQRAVPPPNSVWLTIRQAAVRLNIAERTLREHMRTGAIKFVDVGHGRSRSAPRFTPPDITEFQERQRGQQWPSTSAQVRRTTNTSSSTEVLDFAALRAARASAKPKSSSARSGKRRRRKPNVVKL
jgi:excisionase family DNA binding protein